MNLHDGTAPLTIDALRRSFDAAFAVPPPALIAEVDELLLVRIGAVRHAVRARDLTSLLALRHLVPVPGPVAALLGLSVLRGAPIGVYDLGALLGTARAEGTPAWLLVTGTKEARLAFAVDRFERYLRVPRSQLHAPAPEHQGRYVAEVVRLAEGLCSVLDLGAVRAAIAAAVMRDE